MAYCAYLLHCPFFNDRMANMPATAGLMKKRFCWDDPDPCARHSVIEGCGMDALPDDLYPTQFARAQEIVAAQAGG